MAREDRAILKGYPRPRRWTETQRTPFTPTYPSPSSTHQVAQWGINEHVSTRHIIENFPESLGILCNAKTHSPVWISASPRVQTCQSSLCSHCIDREVETHKMLSLLLLSSGPLPWQPLSLDMAPRGSGTKAKGLRTFRRPPLPSVSFLLRPLSGGNNNGD